MWLFDKEEEVCKKEITVAVSCLFVNPLRSFHNAAKNWDAALSVVHYTHYEWSRLFTCHKIMGDETAACLRTGLLMSLHHRWIDRPRGDPPSCLSSYKARQQHNTHIYLSVVWHIWRSLIPRTHHHHHHVWAEIATHLYCFAQVPKADDLSLLDTERGLKLKNISRDNKVIQLTQQICTKIMEGFARGEFYERRIFTHTADLCWFNQCWFIKWLQLSSSKKIHNNNRTPKK